MKLMLHELRGAIAAIEADQLDRAFKMLSRLSRIMEQLVHAWDVLSTMTPTEYSAIRPTLGESSGFQSWQYRCVEFLVGNKRAAMLEQHRARPAALAVVERDLTSPSLYDEALRLLARRGLGVPADHLQRDWTQPYAASPQVEDACLRTAFWRALHNLGPILDRTRRRPRSGRQTSIRTRWPVRPPGRSRGTRDLADPSAPFAGSACRSDERRGAAPRPPRSPPRRRGPGRAPAVLAALHRLRVRRGGGASRQEEHEGRDVVRRPVHRRLLPGRSGARRVRRLGPGGAAPAAPDRTPRLRPPRRQALGERAVVRRSSSPTF